MHLTDRQMDRQISIARVCSNRVRCALKWPTFIFWDTLCLWNGCSYKLHISCADKLYWVLSIKCKIMAQKRCDLCHVTSFWIVGPPLYLWSDWSHKIPIWCTDGWQRVLYIKCKIVGQNGLGLGHMTYFSNCGTPSVSLEWLKLLTSYLVRRLSISLSTLRYIRVI